MLGGPDTAVEGGQVNTCVGEGEVGDGEGTSVGSGVGTGVGFSVGVRVGTNDVMVGGSVVGTSVGLAVGAPVGSSVGVVVGSSTYWEDWLAAPAATGAVAAPLLALALAGNATGVTALLADDAGVVVA